jgi:hypothetical protein
MALTANTYRLHMRRHRQVLAITLVAAALCADRAVAAAPAIRPQVATAAGRLVTRLTVRFRRVVPSARVYETRREGLTPVWRDLPVSDSTTTFGTRLSHLVLRMPPPTC